MSSLSLLNHHRHDPYAECTTPVQTGKMEILAVDTADGRTELAACLSAAPVFLRTVPQTRSWAPGQSRCRRLKNDRERPLAARLTPAAGPAETCVEAETRQTMGKLGLDTVRSIAESTR